MRVRIPPGVQIWMGCFRGERDSARANAY
jgi:hypothetical protein